ncbi:MAG: hypothetical protein IPM42_18600 [Saprospiraceae bacterium]|nr:hypothetical protein [Saprospiraceae bacterium]
MAQKIEKECQKRVDKINYAIFFKPDHIKIKHLYKMAEIVLIILIWQQITGWIF